MERDTLELAHDSLFEKIKHTFKAADADLLNRVRAFLLEKVCEGDSTGYKAADLLLEQDADAIIIASALLAPLVWQNLVDPGDIREHFGPTVAATLENLGFPSIHCFDNRQYPQEVVQTLLSIFGGAPRRALLFITFRLLALENTTDSIGQAARKMARETLDLFVPIANRLSLGALRRRLEDACFHILDPTGYERLRQKVTPIQSENDKCMKILLAGVQRLLDNNCIQGRVQGRTKSLNGIHRKMKHTSKSLEDIMDRVGLRVIVTSVPDCYTVLGLLHAHFKPIPGTFDDYIGLPKDNGYQSLHTCVYPVREISHKPIEFQVRTELMHMEAEHGSAAHWRYKCETAITERDHQRTQWMEGLVRQHKEAVSNEAFVELLYRQVFRNYMVVFGNGGSIVRLADKATVHDYLNITNVKVPKNAIVKVNGKTANMDCLLRDGDSIEVLAIGELPSSMADAHGASVTFFGNHMKYSFSQAKRLETSGIRSPSSN